MAEMTAGMTLEQIDAEIARRQAASSAVDKALADGDLVEAGLAMFRQNPERVLTDAPTLARLLELKQRKEQAEVQISANWSAFGLIASCDVNVLVSTYVPEHLQAEALASIGLSASVAYQHNR